jgi:hypothetical protein
VENARRYQRGGARRRLKAIWNAEQDTAEAPDLARDKLEREDVCAAPGRAAELASRARDWYTACRSAAVAPIQRELPTRVKEELRALGYIN